MNMENYPGNSRKAQNAATDVKEPKQIKKVTSESVRRKKPLGRRFSETFIGGEAMGNVWEHVLYDVLIPAAKDMVSDAVQEGIHRKLYGESRSRNTPRAQASSTYTSYNRYSAPSVLNRREEPRRESRPGMSARARARHDFDEIVLQTKVEAEDVLSQLFEVISTHGVATVADLYDMVGQDSSYVDAQWGWDDLRGSSVTSVKGGYLLDLPRTQPVD